MEPEQRSPREITYQVGWKRRKIVASGRCRDPLHAGQERHEASNNSPRFTAVIRRWNEIVLWKEAPLPSLKWLQAGLMVLPAVLFALFVWMVQWLSRFS